MRGETKKEARSKNNQVSAAARERERRHVNRTNRRARQRKAVQRVRPPCAGSASCKRRAKKGIMGGWGTKESKDLRSSRAHTI